MDKCIVVCVFMIIYLTSTMIFIGIQTMSWESFAISAIKECGIKIRDDAIINSPAILYIVNYNDFVKIVKEKNLDVFFIAGTQANPGNRLVSILNAEIGYVYRINMPIVWYDPFIFQWKNWSPDK